MELRGYPTVDMVQIHAAAYPVEDTAGRFGGLWKIVSDIGFVRKVEFALLFVAHGRVCVWDTPKHFHVLDVYEWPFPASVIPVDRFGTDVDIIVPRVEAPDPVARQQVERRGMPTVEAVQAHAAAYPVKDSAGGVYGGMWLVIEDVGPPFPVLSFARLQARNSRVEIWSGVISTQPLDACAWAHRSMFRPVDQHGMPVGQREPRKSIGGSLAWARLRIAHIKEHIGRADRSNKFPWELDRSAEANGQGIIVKDAAGLPVAQCYTHYAGLVISQASDDIEWLISTVERLIAESEQ